MFLFPNSVVLQSVIATVALLDASKDVMMMTNVYNSLVFYVLIVGSNEPTSNVCVCATHLSGQRGDR